MFFRDHHVIGDILGDGNGLAVAILNGFSDAVVILAIDGNAGFLGSGSSRGQRLSRDLLLGSCRGRAAALPGHFRSRAGSIFSFRGCGGGAGSILPFGAVGVELLFSSSGTVGAELEASSPSGVAGAELLLPSSGATGAELTSSAKTVMPLMVTTTIAARIADRILFARFSWLIPPCSHNSYQKPNMKPLGKWYNKKSDCHTEVTNSLFSNIIHHKRPDLKGK